MGHSYALIGFRTESAEIGIRNCETSMRIIGNNEKQFNLNVISFSQCVDYFEVVVLVVLLEGSLPLNSPLSEVKWSSNRSVNTTMHHLFEVKHNEDGDGLVSVCINVILLTDSKPTNNYIGLFVLPVKISTILF